MATVCPTICNTENLFFLLTQGRCAFHLVLTTHDIISQNIVCQVVFVMDTSCFPFDVVTEILCTITRSLHFQRSATLHYFYKIKLLFKHLISHNIAKYPWIFCGALWFIVYELLFITYSFTLRVLIFISLFTTAHHKTTRTLGRLWGLL